VHVGCDPENNVFFDCVALRGGVRWWQCIDDALVKCDVMLVVIGRRRPVLSLAYVREPLRPAHICYTESERCWRRRRVD
jgi:hypothetical protein